MLRKEYAQSVLVDLVGELLDLDALQLADHLEHLDNVGGLVARLDLARVQPFLLLDGIEFGLHQLVAGMRWSNVAPWTVWGLKE